ncbi:T9SS type A sorting domain-containing protein, partial [bacterium]|nr:T9SS type A sorting domain-containing protein [bacterium]
PMRRRAWFALLVFGLAAVVFAAGPTHIDPVNPPLELDEIVGDTTIIGNSALDNQHNVVNGRTITFGELNNDGDRLATMIFTDLSLDQNTRLVRVNRVDYSSGTGVAFSDGGTGVSIGSRAGYATIGLDAAVDDPVAFPVFHDRQGGVGTPWSVWTAAEYDVLPDIYTTHQLQNPPDASVVQAKTAANGDSLLHIVCGRTGEEIDRFIYYYRVAYDRAGSSFTIANSGGEAEEVTVNNTVTNAVIAVGPDGDRVVIAKTESRFTLGIGDEERDFDNDLVIWESYDGGETWDFGVENHINISDFIPPDPNRMPDTTAANRDTLRADYECSLFIDADGVLHAALAVAPYYYYESTALRTGMIYYWNEVNNEWILIADGRFWLDGGEPAGYDGMVGHPSLYKDPESGNLWCLYNQYSEPGDTLADGSPNDLGETGFLNTDLWMTMSPAGEYNGRLWMKGVNVTNTRTESNSVPAGQCQSERDATIALDNTGDYLHIGYLVDKDAGNSDYGNGPQGSVTQNPVVVQRIAKSELIDLYTQQAEFIRNYPFHVDSSSFWADPQDWQWRDLMSAPERSEETVRPSSFRIASVYPNPFNAVTRIGFEMDVTARATLRVYDVLGREAATLLDGRMQAGRHTVSFHADGLAGGIYFVELKSGGQRQVRKIALVK